MQCYFTTQAVDILCGTLCARGLADYGTEGVIALRRGARHRKRTVDRTEFCGVLVAQRTPHRGIGRDVGTSADGLPKIAVWFGLLALVAGVPPVKVQLDALAQSPSPLFTQANVVAAGPGGAISLTVRVGSGSPD